MRREDSRELKANVQTFHVPADAGGVGKESYAHGQRLSVREERKSPIVALIAWSGGSITSEEFAPSVPNGNTVKSALLANLRKEANFIFGYTRGILILVASSMVKCCESVCSGVIGG